MAVKEVFVHIEPFLYSNDLIIRQPCLLSLKTQAVCEVPRCCDEQSMFVVAQRSIEDRLTYLISGTSAERRSTEGCDVRQEASSVGKCMVAIRATILPGSAPYVCRCSASHAACLAT